MVATRRTIKRWLIIALCGVAAINGILWVVFSEHSPLAFVIGLRHAISQRERGLLYDTDHAALAHIMRDFAAERQWSLNAAPTPPFGWTSWPGESFVYFRSNDESFPPALRMLKPSSVSIFEDHIELEFGGAFLHFGIRAFRPGL